MSIEVRHVSKTFGSFAALKDVNLTVETGELVALLGPSGSGKTTLLRLIGGLDHADPGSGPVLFHGRDVSARNAAERRVGFVFQHYALFKHMTVFENVAFGLRCRPRRDRPNRREIAARVTDLLRLVQLGELASRYPAQLSGGQRQRVALARALAVEPQVLLLDEPFGALDAKVRRELRRWLRRLHDQTHVTTLLVTHDQEEALEVADRVAVMNHGRIEQVGSSADVYDRPANPFVYQFLGSVNLFRGRLDHGGRFRLAAGHGDAAFDAEAFDPADGSPAAPDGHPAVAFVRPHEMEVTRHPGSHDAIGLRVHHVATAGAVVRLVAEADGGADGADDGNPDRPAAGESVEVEITRERYRELKIRPGERVYARPRNVRVLADTYSI